MELLAIPLGCQKTTAKCLVMAGHPAEGDLLLFHHSVWLLPCPLDVLKVEKEPGTYGECAVATLLEDFQLLTPAHKTMACETAHALLRAEKR